MLESVFSAPAIALPGSIVLWRPEGGGVLRETDGRIGTPGSGSGIAGEETEVRAAGMAMTAEPLLPPGMRNRESKS